MKNKKTLTAALIFPILVLTVWCSFLTYQYHTGKRTVFIDVKGYDPRDLLSGHYVQLQPDWKATDCSQFENNICPVEQFKRIYRYYLSQSEAQKIEKILMTNKNIIQLEFIYYKNTAPTLKNLMLDGKPWSSTNDETKNQQMD